MAKKPKYEPHRPMITKTSDSEDAFYNRKREKRDVEDEIDEMFEDQFRDDIQAELTEENLNAHGFHITGSNGA